MGIEQLKIKRKIITILTLMLILMLLTIIINIQNKKNNIIKNNINIEKESEKEHQIELPEGYIGISTPEELLAINENLSGKYILMADLDMTDIKYEIIGQTGFTGIFDGNNYKINNLKIESENQYVGMFGSLNYGSLVQNLILENVDIIGKDITGGLAGFNFGTITNVVVKGKVTNLDGIESKVGGLIGENAGTITNSYVVGKVKSTGNLSVGGLVGYNSGIITNSYTIEEVISTLTKYIGGLVGENAGTITNSYAMSKNGLNTDISCENNYKNGISVGGLVGWNYGTIEKTFSTVKITGVTKTGNMTGNIGGLVGSNSENSKFKPSRKGTIKNSYSAGTINFDKR